MAKFFLQDANEMHLQNVVAYVNRATRRWRKVAAVKFGISQRSKEVRDVSGRGLPEAT